MSTRNERGVSGVPGRRRDKLATADQPSGSKDDGAPLYAAVQFAGTERRSVAQVEILFESAAEANRFATRAGWDDFGIGPVHFHLPASQQPIRCAG